MDTRNLCLKCINWDRRPEGAPGEGMGYCIAKKMIVGPHYRCDFYKLKTADRVASMRRELYGELDPDGEDFE
ncbi:MAG: hypothetical protein QXP70_04515 [Methanomassiliicoccales archaeon]